MEGPPAAQSPSGHLRVARSLRRPEGASLQPGRVGRSSLYFNVTVFGEELHLRLRPNRRLVVPGASVEWQEDFRELFRQPLRRECVYTGDVMGMPGAAVAISNCDGLVRDKPFIKLPFAPCPGYLNPSDYFLLDSPVFGTPRGTMCGLGHGLHCLHELCIPHWPQGSHLASVQGLVRMVPCSFPHHPWTQGSYSLPRALL